MADAHDLPDEEPTLASRRRRWRVYVLALIALLVLALGALYSQRKHIADNVLAGQLAKNGLHATYRIVRISPGEQVVRDLVIGDPARPDLTVEELRIRTHLGFGLPGIGRITAIRPRLYGSVHAGKASFGSLDKVLFKGPSNQPFRLPDLDLSITDGRALVETDWGRVGARLEGEGKLRGGFAGTVAAITPRITAGGCTSGQASLYGTLSVSAEKPRFAGPVRLAGLSCPDRRAALERVWLTLDATADKTLDGFDGKAVLDAARMAYGDQRLDGAAGPMRATWRDRALTARYDLTGRGLVTRQARAASLALAGQARTSGGLARVDVETEVKGSGIAIGPVLDQYLAAAARQGEGTLLAPVAAQIRAALARETRASALEANLIARKGPEGLSLVVPSGTLRGGSGATLLGVSRLQVLGGKGRLRASGNFATGGRGLPQVAGRIETGLDGGLAMRLHLSPYAAGDARIAVPQLAVVQDRAGDWGLAGEALLTGALPGGRAENLALPIHGRIAASGAYRFWPGCETVRFDALRFANLSLDRRALAICPPAGSAIVRGGAGAPLRINAGLPALDVSGRLGQTPIRIASGPIGFEYPGRMSARRLDVTLGPAATASKFRIANLDAQLGKEIAGTFAHSDVSLFAVPLDLLDAQGRWRYANGVLRLSDATFRLEDRQQVDRFQPLSGEGGDLVLQDNVITAHATMHEPRSGREIVRTTIVHDLARGTGQADLDVPGIVFDRSLQADDVSRLALGVVSNLSGTVTGSGRIDWNAKGVTSTGRFASDGLDFAAAFGPVHGLSGEVEFSDLLGLVTAPGQHLAVASINPGIEVDDGIIRFALQPGMILQVEGAEWPFMDGTLTLAPVRMALGVTETRKYVLKVVGLNAATFVQKLGLDNINATGIFDGEMPLVFDASGGRIDHGQLASRPPGGNVAYVGTLTYKDLSTMGNFAFDALKSIDYKSMGIVMDGALGGEIITQIRFEGLSQGIGAKQNFLTKRLAKLPVRFIVNIKAPFFGLFGSLKSLYDPSAISDPRELGLVGAQGQPLQREVTSPTGDSPVPAPSPGSPADPALPAPARPATASTAIQPPVSEDRP